MRWEGAASFNTKQLWTLFGRIKVDKVGKVNLDEKKIAESVNTGVEENEQMAVEHIKCAVAYHAPLIIGSDAHICFNLGDFSYD